MPKGQAQPHQEPTVIKEPQATKGTSEPPQRVKRNPQGAAKNPQRAVIRKMRGKGERIGEDEELGGGGCCTAPVMRPSKEKFVLSRFFGEGWHFRERFIPVLCSSFYCLNNSSSLLLLGLVA